MNTTLGEIEFKLTESQLFKLKQQTNNKYTIIIKNPNGTSYVYYEGVFYDISNQEQIIANYKSLYTVTDMETKIAELEAQVKSLTDENATLKIT